MISGEKFLPREALIIFGSLFGTLFAKLKFSPVGIANLLGTFPLNFAEHLEETAPVLCA